MLIILKYNLKREKVEHCKLNIVTNVLQKDRVNNATEKQKGSKMKVLNKGPKFLGSGKVHSVGIRWISKTDSYLLFFIDDKEEL